MANANALLPAAGAEDGRLLGISIAVNVVLFAAALTFLSLGFESNDDVGMEQIAAGILTGHPSPEIVFSNVLIGRVLAGLYRWTERINWYTLYLVAAHFLTMMGLLYAFLRLHASRMAVILFVILFVQFEAALLLRLQFTSTAAMAGAAGLLLILASRSENGGPSRWAIGFGGFLIVLSALIRGDSMFYALVLMGPLLAYELVIRRAWRTVATVGLFALVGWIAIEYDAWHYRSDERWRGFPEYNEARASLHDLPIAEYEAESRFFFDRVGWSRNDWEMFRSWFFTDPKLYSYPHLKSLVDRFRGTMRIHPAVVRYVRENLRPLSLFSSLMYANVILAFLLSRGGRLRLWVLGLLQCVLVEGIFILFAEYARLPPRVVLPAFFASSAVMFHVSLETASQERLLIRASRAFDWTRGLIMGGAAACYAALCFQVGERHLALSALHRRDHRAYTSFVRAMQDRYVAQEPNSVFLNWGTRFPLQLAPPFDDVRDFHHIRMVNLGWTTHSPPFDDAVSRLGIENLYQATYEKPNVYLFATPTDLKRLAQFVSEHYQQDIFVKHVDSFLIGTGAGTRALNLFQMAAHPVPNHIQARKQPAARTLAVSRKSP